MKIPVINVREGDFLPGLGSVERVRHFQGASACGRANVERKEDYAEVIATEVESCYSSLVSKVVIQATLGSRSFLPEDSVEVIRLPKVVFKSKAV